jgi:hypothetical protein
LAGLGAWFEVRYNCKTRLLEWIAGIFLAIFFEVIQEEVAANISDHFPYLFRDEY